MNDVQKFILNRAMQKVANASVNPPDVVFGAMENELDNQLAPAMLASGTVGAAGGAGVGLLTNWLLGNKSKSSKIKAALIGAGSGLGLGLLGTGLSYNAAKNSMRNANTVINSFGNL